MLVRSDIPMPADPVMLIANVESGNRDCILFSSSTKMVLKSALCRL